MERVKSFLKRIDVPPAQVVVEVALVEMPTPVGANTTARDVEAMVNVGRSQVLTTARLLATDGEAGEVSLTLERPLGRARPGIAGHSHSALEGDAKGVGGRADHAEHRCGPFGSDAGRWRRIVHNQAPREHHRPDAGWVRRLAGAFSTGTAEERSSTALLVRAETVSSESEDSIEESAHPPRIPMLQS